MPPSLSLQLSRIKGVTQSFTIHYNYNQEFDKTVLALQEKEYQLALGIGNHNGNPLSPTGLLNFLLPGWHLIRILMGVLTKEKFAPDRDILRRGYDHEYVSAIIWWKNWISYWVHVLLDNAFLWNFETTAPQP